MAGSKVEVVEWVGVGSVATEFAWHAYLQLQHLTVGQWEEQIEMIQPAVQLRSTNPLTFPGRGFDLRFYPPCRESKPREWKGISVWPERDPRFFFDDSRLNELSRSQQLSYHAALAELELLARQQDLLVFDSLPLFIFSPTEFSRRSTLLEAAVPTV